MLNVIVCAIDGSEHANNAATLAIELAARFESKLRFIHIYMAGMTLDELSRFEDNSHLRNLVREESKRLSNFLIVSPNAHAAKYVPRPSHEVVTRIAEVILEDAKLAATSASVADVETVTAEGNAAQQILQFAQRENADMIAMGSRGLGALKELFLGSTSNKVSHQASCACLTVK